jgi:hypothetical protein
MRTSTLTPKKGLNAIYIDVGDVQNARSVGQLPRGLQQMYNSRRPKNSETVVSTNPGQIIQNDALFVLLERAKHEDSNDGFMRDFQVHPTFYCVLATKRQLDDLGIFCTDPTEFSVFCVDPTFNVFEEENKLSLTVSTYRNLKLRVKKTKKPPVFIGPLLMHQSKDWQTYSKFAHSLVTDKPELSGLLAFGTDGEKALKDGLQRNFLIATALRCMIHSKKNIEEDLSKRNFSSEDRQKFMCDIFGWQDGEVKYAGLVDSKSRSDFETTLKSLELEWKSRGNGNGDAFVKWFSTYWVRILKLIFA